MASGSGNSIAETAPPMAHAVGGSLGSAIALLLLYPLERARVELQTLTASSSSSSSTATAATTTVSHNHHHPQDINYKVQPIQESSRGGGRIKKKSSPHPSLSSDESWVTCLRDPENLSPSSNSSSHQDHQSHVSVDAAETKLGLVSCIYQLHQKGQLYGGVMPVVITMAASNFVFFYMHSFLKQLLLPLSSSTKGRLSHGKTTTTLYLSLIASSLAGVINVIITNPLWVANLRIVTSSSSNDSGRHDNNRDNHDETHNKKNNNLWHELVHIVQTEGWAHLWQGTPASLLLVSNPVIQFVTYEQLKTQWLHFMRQSSTTTTATTRMSSTTTSVMLKPLEAFLLGAMAKAISTILTYPLQLTQTVLRVQKQDEKQQQRTSDSNQEILTGSSSSLQQHQVQQTPRIYKGTLDCLIQIYKLKGLEGWFTGMRTKLLQTVLTAAFTFLTYEQILKAIMTVHRALLAKRKMMLAS